MTPEGRVPVGIPWAESGVLAKISYNFPETMNSPTFKVQSKAETLLRGEAKPRNLQAEALSPIIPVSKGKTRETGWQPGDQRHTLMHRGYSTGSALATAVIPYSRARS